MTRVDFYEAKGLDWEQALCALIEKIYKSGQNIYLWTDGAEASARWDDLLWTFRADSFVPHELLSETTRPESRVVVGSTPGNPNKAHCLILARDASPGETVGFERIVDLVPKDAPPLLELARKRYSAFKKAGFHVFFHQDDK